MGSQLVCSSYHTSIKKLHRKNSPDVRILKQDNIFQQTNERINNELTTISEDKKQETEVEETWCKIKIDHRSHTRKQEVTQDGMGSRKECLTSTILEFMKQ